MVRGQPGRLQVEGTALTESNEAAFDGWIGLLTALEDAALLALNGGAPALNGEAQGQLS